MKPVTKILTEKEKDILRNLGLLTNRKKKAPILQEYKERLDIRCGLCDSKSVELSFYTWDWEKLLLSWRKVNKDSYYASKMKERRKKETRFTCLSCKERLLALSKEELIGKILEGRRELVARRWRK